MIYDDFTNIKFSIQNLDIFIVRTSIFNALKEISPYLNGSLLDIGCGKMPYKEYILNNSGVQNYTGIDIEGALEYDINIRPDFTWDGKIIPFEADIFDCAICTEVLEHCPIPEEVFSEVFRILKPGGYLFLTVPFLWNLHEIPHDEYRYTPFSLERLLKNCGFTILLLKANGGWHASFGQMLGLWVRRAPLNSIERRIL